MDVDVDVTSTACRAAGAAGTNADAEPTVAAKDRRASKEFLDIIVFDCLRAVSFDLAS